MAAEKVPVQVVGSSKFGIYPKISLEKTINMFISDNWLINYAGYRRLKTNLNGQEGRGLFHSIRGNFLISVIDDLVYKVDTGLGIQKIGTLNTRFGEVYMDENLASQICIVDGNDAWIYNYQDGTFTEQTLNVGFNLIPGYVTYHNSFFLIAPSVNDPNNTNSWYAFQRASDSTISLVNGSVFPLQTKPDKCLAIKRIPGRSNHILVIGSSVCEVFTNVGGNQNYRRNASFNIDSGCVSISTIAANEEFICFLAQNETNAPTLLFTNGSETRRISDDGIDHLLQSLKRPDLSTAFFYRQDGHLFYQITFFSPQDNLSLIYDFNAQKFYHVTDDRMNYHPARQIVYYEGKSIFVGLERGGLYEMSTDIDGAYEDLQTLKGRPIPRIRITPTIRLPDSGTFDCNEFAFWIEQGINQFSELDLNQPECFEYMVNVRTGLKMLTLNDKVMLTHDGYCIENNKGPRVDLNFSKDGNRSFSNIVGINLNPLGKYKNRMVWHRLGYANEIALQLSFWGLNRFVVNNGYLEIGK